MNAGLRDASWNCVMKRENPDVSLLITKVSSELLAIVILALSHKQLKWVEAEISRLIYLGQWVARRPGWSNEGRGY